MTTSNISAANTARGSSSGRRKKAVDPLEQLLAVWGEAIRQGRIAIGRSQLWLAEELGVNQSLVSFWEHGRRAPSLEKQLAIARALGVSPAELFPLPQEVA